MHILRGHLSVCECVSFPFGLDGGMWELIVHVLVLDHCLSCLLHYAVMHQNCRWYGKQYTCKCISFQLIKIIESKKYKMLLFHVKHL